MQHKPFLILGLTITFVLSWLTICSAEGLVHLKAEHVAYDYEGQIVSASDEVVITYKDLTISSSHAFIAIKENQMEADGSIEIKRGDETYYGDHLSYDFKAEKGYLEPINLEVSGDEIKGTVFGKGKQAVIDGENSIVYKASLTTCDLEDPHYHLTGKEMDYYPNDRLIIYQAVYYEGTVPLFYWPYLFISLKDKDSNFLTPVAGHDETMGWFIIFGYRYYFNDYWKGTAYFDWMSILGRRYRIQQDFQFGERDKLTTEFAWLDNKVTDNNELSTTLRYDKYFGKDWNFVLDSKWEQATIDDQSLSTYETHDLINRYFIQGELKKESGNPYLRMNYSDTEYNRYYSIAPSVNWQPFKGGNLNLSGNWSSVYHKDTIDDPNLNYDPDTYNLILNYNQNLFSDRLKLSLYHQLSSYGNSLTDSLSYIGPNWKLGWFPQTQFTSDFTYRSDPYEDGYKWGGNLSATSLPIYENKDRGFRITTGWYLKERLYWNNYQKNDGEDYVFSDQFAANASIQADKDITKHLKGSIGLGWTEMMSYYNDQRYLAGLTDTFYPGLDTTYGLQYDNPDLKLNVNFNGGYNIQSGIWETQNLNASWFPNDISSFRYNLSYTPDPEYMTSTLSMTYKPNQNTYLAVDYSYTTSTWNNGIQSLNAQADIVRPIGNSWTVELHSRYNFFDRYINYARVDLTYDWHCRKILFGYDVTREQYVVQMIIKAFPSSPIGLGNQEDYFWNWYNEVSQ